jgi:hypothetical protein
LILQDYLIVLKKRSLQFIRSLLRAAADLEVEVEAEAVRAADLEVEVAGPELANKKRQSKVIKELEILA